MNNKMHLNARQIAIVRNLTRRVQEMNEEGIGMEEILEYVKEYIEDIADPEEFVDFVLKEGRE